MHQSAAFRRFVHENMGPSGDRRMKLYMLFAVVREQWGQSEMYIGDRGKAARYFAKAALYWRTAAMATASLKDADRCLNNWVMSSNIAAALRAVRR